MLTNNYSQCGERYRTVPEETARLTLSRSAFRVLSLLLLLTGFPLVLVTQTSAPSTAVTASQENKAAGSLDVDVHPYHEGPPIDALPQLTDAKDFASPRVQNAYRIANKLKAVLYQQPCYCHCGHYLGHKSLLDCYVGKHAAVCGICLQEVFYSYEQTEKGQTATQIREGLAMGKWKTVETNKYDHPLRNLNEAAR
jgi:Protein of unknown function with PCYCGC motif